MKKKKVELKTIFAKNETKKKKKKKKYLVKV